MNTLQVHTSTAYPFTDSRDGVVIYYYTPWLPREPGPVEDSCQQARMEQVFESLSLDTGESPYLAPHKQAVPFPTHTTKNPLSNPE